MVRFVGRNATSVAQSARHDRCHMPSQQPRHPSVAVSNDFAASTPRTSRSPLGRENIIEISHVVCLGTHYHQVERDISAEETFSTPRLIWLKNFDAMEVLIMDQGTEFGADFQGLCYNCGTLPIVCDLETPWQNVVTERH